MFCEYMISCYLFPFILLFSTSSMFELHVVVAGIVMFNIMELIMEIVPNYPTYKRQSLGMPPRHPFFIGKNQVTFRHIIFLLLHALCIFLKRQLF
jgi:hypothetical protein